MNDEDVIVGMLHSGKLVIGKFVALDVVLEDVLLVKVNSKGIVLIAPFEPLATGAAPMVSMEDLVMCQVVTAETRQSYLDVFSPIVKPRGLEVVQ